MNAIRLQWLVTGDRKAVMDVRRKHHGGAGADSYGIALAVYPGLAFGGQLEDLIAAWAEGTAVRFYLGYAGWGPQQLLDELGEGAWHVIRAQPKQVFPERPEALWGKLMGEIDPAWRHLKHQPRDPDLN